MNIIKDENGDVYAWFMLVVAVIVMAGIYMISMQMIDPLTDKYDTLSDQGRITEQNVSCFNTVMGLFIALPVIMIFGLSAWAVVAVIRTKQGD